MLARLVKGDVLVVAELDRRAFRNAADALATAEQLKARKVDLIVADMGDPNLSRRTACRACSSGCWHSLPMMRSLWLCGVVC